MLRVRACVCVCEESECVACGVCEKLMNLVRLEADKGFANIASACGHIRAHRNSVASTHGTHLIRHYKLGLFHHSSALYSHL